MSGPQKRRRSPLDHPDAKAFLAEAQKLSEGGGNRKHHLVPASYLRRWGSQVRVTDLELGIDYPTSPDNAARRTDFYRLDPCELDGIEAPPLIFESLLGQVEGDVVPAIESLLAPTPRLEREQVFSLSSFLALQFTRGTAYREERKWMSNAVMNAALRNVDDDWIRAQLEKAGRPATASEVAEHREFLDAWNAGEARLVPRDSSLVAHSFHDAAEMVPFFARRLWVVYRTSPILVTCDEPVVLVGGPGEKRSQRAGLMMAGVILFPLTRDRLLVMVGPEYFDRHPGVPGVIGDIGLGDLSTVETNEINREIAANCARWIFERPDKRVGANLPLPPLPPPMNLDEIGPAGGERVVHSYKPNRWSMEAVEPPWPVSRWWG